MQKKNPQTPQKKTPTTKQTDIKNFVCYFKTVYQI